MRFLLFMIISFCMVEEICMYKVLVLFEGYSYMDIEKKYRVNGICILVIGKDKKIFVDIGSL